MKKNNISKFFTLILTLFVLLFSSCKKENKIFNDFDAAKEAAKSSQKDILVLVTVEGDDENSSSFIEKVVNDSNFKSLVQKNYIVSHLDFSSESYKKTVAKEGANEEQQKIADEEADRIYRNSNIANSLNVIQTPSAYILTNNPYVITQINFNEENVTFEDFQKALEEASPVVEEYHKNLKTAENGKDEERLLAIEKIVNSTPTDFMLFLEDLVQTYIQLDPENKSSNLARYLTLNANIQATNSMAIMDTQSASEIFVNLAKSQFLSEDEKQSAYYNAAYILTYSAEPDFVAILSLLDAAIQVYPESPDNQGLLEIRNSISQAMQEALTVQ